MALIDNVVHEQSTSTGSGNMTIGALNGRQRFSSAFSTGGSDTFYYSIMNQDAGEWEIGTGSLADANTLVRDTVLASSNSGLAVNFSAGTKDVVNGIPQSDAALLSDLASTSNGFGASLIGIEDSGALIAATTVEGALAENRAAIDAIEADYLTSSAIGSTVQAYDADLTTWAGITPGTGVGTALAVNVGTAGAFVVNGGALGTPSSGTLTNATGLPVSSGISGLGTGVATALAVAVGSAGALVVNGGALGTPSSGTLTNATGLPISTGVSGLGTGVATFLATPSSANLAGAVTGETGSGALVFGTSPGFTTSANPASDDGATLGTTSLKWSDLFLANGAVINFNSGDVTITHSAANTLTFAGASSGYIFSDGNVGIGTASPGALLSMGSLLANTKLAIYDDGTYYYGFGVQSSELRIHTAVSTDLITFRFGPAASASMTFSSTVATFAVPVKVPTYTVGTLPAAGTVGAGSRAYVTDANATTFASTVAAGGSNTVPVYSNGSNWLIG